MDGQARVGSIDALEAFRAALIQYTARVRRALDDVSGEVKRTRGWLESEQRRKWEAECRRRQRALEQAEQELFTARLSSLRDDKSAQQRAVARARRELAAAEEKLAAIKRWRTAYETKVEPLARQLESLRSVMAREMPEAAVRLADAVSLLQDYAGTKPVPRVATDEGEGGGP